MKKVGIVTFFSNYNYGSVLQAYALSQFLFQKGYDAEIIDYQNKKNLFNIKMRLSTIFSRLWVFLIHPNIWKLTLDSRKKAKNSIRKLSNETIIQYDIFLKDKLKPYKKFYHRESDFDFFICGSDQIWQIAAPGLNKVFFLRFTNPQKRIAYAVSLGSTVVPQYNAKQFKKYVNSFHAISVRENASKKMIKNICNQDVTHVIDPTLLVGREFWDNILSKTAFKQNYVLCYFLDECKNSGYIMDLAKKSNLEVLWVETGVTYPTGSRSIIPSPFEFVSLIKNADYIFTDSFHACCFSSLFEKNFYVIHRNYQGYPAQHVRIEELLSMIQMNDREFNSCIEIKELQPISKERYSDANVSICKLRNISSQFLINALES